MGGHSINMSRFQNIVLSVCSWAHKCTTKEGNQYKAIPKVMNKWVPKQDKMAEGTQIINGEKHKGKKKVSEE